VGYPKSAVNNYEPGSQIRHLARGGTYAAVKSPLIYKIQSEKSRKIFQLNLIFLLFDKLKDSPKCIIYAAGVLHLRLYFMNYGYFEVDSAITEIDKKA
jgi:hypothetical protein